MAYPFTVLVFALRRRAMEVHPVERAHSHGKHKLEEMENGEGEITRRHPKDAHICVRERSVSAEKCLYERRVW
jgi:hypothetical protein